MARVVVHCWTALISDKDRWDKVGEMVYGAFKQRINPPITKGEHLIMTNNETINFKSPEKAKINAEEKLEHNSSLKSKRPLFLKIGSILGKILFFLIGSFAAFYILEAQVHEPWKMSVDFQVFNALFFFFLLAFWLMITRRGLPAMLITSLIAFAIGYANRAVLVFRDNPIFPWDILSARTAFSVGDNYDWPLPKNGWWILLLLALVIGLALITRIKIPKGRFRNGLAVGSLLLLLIYGSLFQNYTFTNYFNFNETLFAQKYLYQQNGFIPSFLINLRYIRVDKPKGYSLDQVKMIEEKIDQEIINKESAPLADEKDKPNILVVMNEAFSDLSVLSPFETNIPVMPFLDSLKENTIRGNLFVPVVGGNTATTEYEFLTGDSMAFLPSDSVAYQQFIQTENPSLPSTLKESGYRTIAMHPYGEKGWNRDLVYPLLGFDEMFFLKDFKHQAKIRKYVSDYSVYQEMIDLFEKKKADERLFYFTVTMQNHGGYSTPLGNFRPAVSVVSPDEGYDLTTMEIYLSLMRESDSAFKSLIKYFSEVDEKTIILFFGDHQPHDYAIRSLLDQNGYGYSKEEMDQNRRIVPYVMWANYPISEQAELDTSPNFLSSLLMETAGLEQSPYGYFLSNLRKTIPVMAPNFYSDQSRRYLYSEAADEHKLLFKEYEMLQYNRLFETAKRHNNLFYPARSKLGLDNNPGMGKVANE